MNFEHKKLEGGLEPPHQGNKPIDFKAFMKSRGQLGGRNPETLDFTGFAGILKISEQKDYPSINEKPH